MNVFERFYDWAINLNPAVKTFLGLLETDQGKILQDLVETAKNDVVTGGFTTVSFVAAGKDVLAKLVAQEINEFSLQHIIALINISVAPLVPAVITPATEPPPAAA